MSKDFLIGSCLTTALLLTFIIIVVLSVISLKNDNLPGQAVAVIPAQKIQKTDKHPDYNTIPPSSGWYADFPVRDGIFTSPISNEQIVYALTKGKIVITYNCNYKVISPTPAPPEPPPPEEETSTPSSSLEEKDSKDLEEQQSPEQAQAIWQQVEQENKACGEIISDLREILNKKSTKDLLLFPLPKLDTRVAIVSWGRIDKMLWVDKNRITKFIDAFRGKKPNI